MKRNASAVRHGDLKSGNGTISTDSGVLRDALYSFATRFEHGIGTHPQELIAAAHAGCFSMARLLQFAEAGKIAESIRTTAAVSLDKADGGFAITAVHRDLTARIPGADRQAFERAALAAKAGYPVSKVLNAAITLDTKLES